MLQRARPLHLGRYELLFRLAGGGMAEVFVGRLLGEGGFARHVAIKRMLPHLAEDPRFVDMFLDEGRLAGHVSSPHVVQTLDVGRDRDGTLFIVMELVRGASLHALLSAHAKRGTHVPLPVAVSLLIDAARGLHDAHEAATPSGEPMHLVHRDVSPQNLLIGIDGRARITDFGVARAVHRNATTTTGELKGKLGYFAPEQARGEIDHRVDVFALGIVAWELLTGRRLFDGDNPMQKLEKVRSMVIPAPSQRRPEVPASIDRVVAHALDRDLQTRCASAGELAEELRAAARETGLELATPREVGAHLRDVLGDVVEALDQRLAAAARVESQARTEVLEAAVAVVSGTVVSGTVVSGTAASGSASNSAVPGSALPIEGPTLVDGKELVDGSHTRAKTMQASTTRSNRIRIAALLALAGLGAGSVYGAVEGSSAPEAIPSLSTDGAPRPPGPGPSVTLQVGSTTPAAPPGLHTKRASAQRASTQRASTQRASTQRASTQRNEPNGVLRLNDSVEATTTAGTSNPIGTATSDAPAPSSSETTTVNATSNSLPAAQSRETAAGSVTDTTSTRRAPSRASTPRAAIGTGSASSPPSTAATSAPTTARPQPTGRLVGVDAFDRGTR